MKLLAALRQFDPLCKNIVIPVRDTKVQASLWKFDADQVQAAYAGIETFMESAKVLALTLDHDGYCGSAGCLTVHDAWVIRSDPIGFRDARGICAHPSQIGSR